MRIICFFLSLIFTGQIYAQVNDTLVTEATRLHEFNVYKDKYAYKREVERVRKIYPYALHAANLLDKFDEELGLINSKRKKRQYGKHAHAILKSDYNFVIRDLYRSEGVLLMKLIYRETGLTAAEIIKKYRGKINSELYDQLGKIWDQDLDVKYDPEGRDWLTECIIIEIENNLIEFTPEAKMVTKEEYKENMREYRSQKKEYKIGQKEAKKVMRAKKRAGSTKG